MTSTRLLGGLAALALLALPTAAAAEDLTFMLTNQSSLAITNFFTSPANVEEWQEDVFGEAYLPSGNQVPVTIADGSDQCVYDMKFIAENGAELVVPAIDLCELADNEYILLDN